MTLEQLLNRLQARNNGGSGWQALCPAHDDRNASLSISEAGGKVLLYCHAGCKTEDVLAKLGLNFGDLEDRPKIVATYDYVNAAGELVFQVVRLEPKSFRQRRPDGKGGWLWNMDGVSRVLFNLPAVLQAGHIVIVEGEKDVLTAREKYSLTATTNCGGGGKNKWLAEYSEYLRDKDITIIPDNDETGREHAEEVARSLHGKVKTLAVCLLPVKDLSDYAALGFSKESLVELIQKTPPWKPGPEKQMESYSVSDLFAAREQSVHFLVWPLLAPGLAVVVDALPKDGKSVLLFRGILAGRQNKPFLGYATNPARVLYISEQSRASLGMQLRECGYDGAEPVEELRFITREVWSRYVFDDFVRTVEKDFLPGGYNAIVWDTLATIARLEDVPPEINRLRRSRR
jgi:hypothetical protein